MKNTNTKKFAMVAFVLAIILASCTPRKYIVSVSSEVGGTASVVNIGNIHTDSLRVFHGDTVTVTASPNDGFAFSRWTTTVDENLPVDLNVNPTTFSMPKRDIALRAEFREIRKDYYGTWTYKNNNGNEQVTFDMNTLRYEVTLNYSNLILTNWYTIENLKWEAIQNNVGENSADYPSGFKITGTVAHSFNIIDQVTGISRWPKVNDTIDMWIYIRKTDKSVLMKGNSEFSMSKGNSTLFVKQPQSFAK